MQKNNRTRESENAIVIAPLVSLYRKGETRTFELEKMNTVRRLWDMLVGIQLQMRQDHLGWVREIG